MKKKLYRLAWLSSPILAIYGVAPLYIFSQLSFGFFVQSIFSLTLMILVFWTMNIQLVDLAGRPLRRYALSFLFTVLLHSLILVLMPKPQLQGDLFSFIAYPLIATFAINTIILIIINSYLLQYQKEAAESELRNLKLISLEAQKQVLLQQLQPHFLFNALSTLKSLIREDPGEAEDYSVKLSEFLRYSVQAHSHELVSLEEELQFTRDYIDLQKARFGDALNCRIAIPGEVLKKKLPVYALQTLVENAIKHNAFTVKKPLFIQIGLEGDCIRVSNNKLPKQSSPPEGTGLDNLNRRYQLAAGQEIRIINQPDEFIVCINLL